MIASPDQCHVRSRLVQTATELEKAGTLPELAAALRSLRRLWRSIGYHLCAECRSAPEFSRLARFVSNAARENASPDDHCIAELVRINLRASDCLRELCPGPCSVAEGELAGNEPLPDGGACCFGPVFDTKGMQNAGDVKLHGAQR